MGIKNTSLFTNWLIVKYIRVEDKSEKLEYILLLDFLMSLKLANKQHNPVKNNNDNTPI